MLLTHCSTTNFTLDTLKQRTLSKLWHLRAAVREKQLCVRLSLDTEYKGRNNNKNLHARKFRSTILFISNTIYNLLPVHYRKLKRVGSDKLRMETLKA